MSCDKTLRDIWAATDRSSIDVMKGSGGLPQSSRSSTITSYSNKNYVNNSDKSNQKQSNLPEENSSQLFHGIPYLNYYSQKPSTVEDDSASLISIWAPTVKDELITPEDQHKNPLLSFKTPNLETAQHANKSSITADDSYETISTDSDSELSNNYGSDVSPNENNEETFGKYADLPGKLKPSKSELSLSELSEATLKCELWKKNVTPKLENENSRDSEQLKNKTGVSRTEKSVTETKPVIKRVHNQNYPHPQFQSKNEKKKIICNGKYGKRRGVPNRSLTSKFAHLSVDTDEILSVSRENLTFQGVRSSSNQKGKNSMNIERRFAIETHEVIGKKGKEMQKITYVQGKIIEKSSEIHNDSHQPKLKWNSEICSIKPQNNERIVRKNHFTNYRSPQNNYKCFPRGQQNLKEMNGFEQSNFNMFKHVENGTREMFPGRNRQPNCNYYRRSDFSSNPREIVRNFKKGNEKEHIKISEHVPSFKNHYENRNRLHEKKFFQHSTIKPVYDYKFEGKVENSTLGNESLHKQQRIHNELSWNVVHCIKEEHNTRTKFQENPKVEQQTLPKCSDNGVSTDTNEIKTKEFSKYDQEDNFIFFESWESKTRSDENSQLIKADNTLVKNTHAELKERLSIEKRLSLLRASKLKEELAQNKLNLKFNVKEMADLIVGSHRALDIFKSFYHEWIGLRQESIVLLEQISNAIVNSSNKSNTIKDAAAMFATAANVVSLVPHPAVSLGAKIAAAIGGVVSKIFGQGGYSKKERDAKEFEVKQVFQRDIDTSSLVYIYGVQCGSQFQETTQFIKNFHQKLQEENLQSFITDRDALEFIKEISEYNPRNELVFYRRLKLEYERLIKNSKSDESKDFVRVFRDIPEAVSVINLLPWTFNADGFENSIVQNSWEELFTLFNGGSINIDAFLRKIQNCLFFLKKEKSLLERTAQNVLY